MNRYVKLIVAIMAPTAYLLALRYMLPSDEPYFILGIGIVGLITWLLGTASGLVATLLLIPLTRLVYDQFSISTSYLSVASSPPYLGIQILAVVAIGHLRREKNRLTHKADELEDTNQHLQNTLSHVQEIGGLHNLCGECKKIQDANGIWKPVDLYLKEQTKMEFSHCICPDCADHFNDPVPPSEDPA